MYCLVFLMFSKVSVVDPSLMGYYMSGAGLPATAHICTKHLQDTVWWSLCEVKMNWAVPYKQICCNRSCFHVQQSCTCFSACGLHGLGCNRHCMALQCRQPMFPLKTHRCGRFLRNRLFKLVEGDYCFSKHCRFMI